MMKNMRRYMPRLQVFVMLLLLVSSDAGVTRLRDHMATKAHADAPKLSAELKRELDAAWKDLLTQQSSANVTAKKEPLTFCTIALIIGLVLGATSIAANAYKTHFRQFTADTLEGLGKELAESLNQTATNLEELTTIIQRHQTFWSQEADNIRGLLEGLDVSRLLKVYMDNMFPAVDHQQAAGFKHPNPVVVDLNTEHLSSVLEQVLAELGDSAINGVSMAVFSASIQEALKGMGYTVAAATFATTFSAVTLSFAVVMTSWTVKSLVDERSACTTQLSYASEEVALLAADANFLLCSFTRSTRVMHKVHVNMHDYMLSAGEEPPQEVMDSWNRILFDMKEMDAELDQFWDGKGEWCHVEDTRGLDWRSTQCITDANLPFSRETYMCVVDHLVVDDDFDPQTPPYSASFDTAYTAQAHNSRTKAERTLAYSTAPRPSPGLATTVYNDLDLASITPITGLAQVNLPTSLLVPPHDPSEPVDFYGFYQQRRFVPASDIGLLRNTAYTTVADLDQAIFAAGDAKLENIMAANLYGRDEEPQLQLMISREPGAPVTAIEFCDSKQSSSDGWFRAHLAAVNSTDLCPTGDTVHDGGWIFKDPLCYRKDWSMVDAITDREQIEAEALLLKWLAESPQFTF